MSDLGRRLIRAAKEGRHMISKITNENRHEGDTEYKAMKAEIERLGDDSESYGLREAVISDQGRELEFLRLERARLRAALDKYACHLPGCIKFREQQHFAKCDCGLQEVLEGK